MYVCTCVPSCLSLSLSPPSCLTLPRKSNPIVYKTSGPYSVTNIVQFLQQHTTHPIVTASDVNRSNDGIRLADWSHEGWLLWIQAQSRILNLEKKNAQLYHKVKELEHQLVTREKPQDDYVSLAKEKIDEMYVQLQHLIMQQFNMQTPPGSVPPPPSHMTEEDVTTFADFMSGKTFAAEKQEGKHPDSKVCHSEARTQEKADRRLKDGRQLEEGRQPVEGRQPEEGRQSEEGGQLDESRQFDGGVKDGFHKSELPHTRTVLADDAGIAFYVPARKTEKDAEEAPDGSEVEESEPVNHATGIMTDDAGLAIQQYDRYGSADNSGSKLKAVGDGPTSDAAQFEDATGHDGNIPLDSLTSRHDHKKYSMPFQEEAPIEGDTHMRQTAREALSVTTDSTSQDIPGSLAGDDSLSYLDPDQGDNSNSLSRRQTQRMGDLG